MGFDPCRGARAGPIPACRTIGSHLIVPQVCCFWKPKSGGPQPAAQHKGVTPEMNASTLRGPFALTDSEVDRQVTHTSAGAYALNRSGPTGTFYVHYVGRSDVNVNARLKAHVDKYVRFMFEYCSSPKAAFEEECRLYHDFTPTDNLAHPARPAGSGWKCPKCALFG